MLNHVNMYFSLFIYICIFISCLLLWMNVWVLYWRWNYHSGLFDCILETSNNHRGSGWLFPPFSACYANVYINNWSCMWDRLILYIESGRMMIPQLMRLSLKKQIGFLSTFCLLIILLLQNQKENTRGVCVGHTTCTVHMGNAWHTWRYSQKKGLGCMVCTVHLTDALCMPCTTNIRGALQHALRCITQ